MKLVRWTLFTWDLRKLEGVDVPLEAPYQIRPALKSEDKAVKNVIITAFSLDSDWSYVLHGLRGQFEESLDEIFDRRGEIPCLVLTNGPRIIGASALSLDPAAQNHLVSGPCVLNEYRNRGLGSALLHRSLLRLKEAGLERAQGLTKQAAPAEKFIYPKFNGESSPSARETELVES